MNGPLPAELKFRENTDYTLYKINTSIKATTDTFETLSGHSFLRLGNLSCFVFLLQKNYILVTQDFTGSDHYLGQYNFP